MPETMLSEIRRLSGLTVGQLHDRYVEVFGEPARSRNRAFLCKRIAWRMQEIAEGGISERAKQRARSIARDADLRVIPPRKLPALPMATARSAKPRDPRLPAAGATLRRTFRGVVHTVRILEDGFEYQDQHYPSLSAVAREITGTRWNGLAFFGCATTREVV